MTGDELQVASAASSGFGWFNSLTVAIQNNSQDEDWLTQRRLSGPSLAATSVALIEQSKYLAKITTSLEARRRAVLQARGSAPTISFWAQTRGGWPRPAPLAGLRSTLNRGRFVIKTAPQSARAAVFGTASSTTAASSQILTRASQSIKVAGRALGGGLIVWDGISAYRDGAGSSGSDRALAVADAVAQGSVRWGGAWAGAKGGALICSPTGVIAAACAFGGGLGGFFAGDRLYEEIKEDFVPVISLPTIPFGG